MSGEEENVNVVVRIRPMQAHEKKNGDVPCVKAEKSGKEVQVKVGPLDAQVYRCHRCFNAETSQSDFFVECGITDLLNSAVDGYRACAFAFGQTGAGKTFTMVGATKGISHKDKQVGLIARSLEYLYMKLSSAGQKYRIRLSCLEIYHEHVYDLFAEEKERLPLAVREHATEGFFLEGSRLVECKDYEVACAALDVAVKNRQVGGHDLNSRSSRSHCMTEIYIDTASSTYDDGPSDHFLNRGKMTLVDLAGSERLKNTNSTGKVLQEAGFINRSLYVLGKVIAGLVRTNGDLNHKDVPYRDSKLTKLLISSLGGNSRTVLIACVSEAKGSQAETLRTLKFSMSCARIRNKPVKFLDPQVKLILDLKDEIKRLRNENKRLRSTMVTAPSSTSDSIGDHFAPFDETDSPLKRASSANGFDDRVRQNGYRKSKQSLLSNNKKKKQAPKPKKKQPEIFYKYPQLQNILKEELKKGKNVRDSSDKNSIQSIGSYQSRNNRGAPQSQGPSASLLLESEPSFAHDDGRSVESSSRHKVNLDILDEVIHRKAGGPMVFKDKDSPIPSLRDTRLNQYYPAENYVRAMDAVKDEVFEQPKGQVESQITAEQANIPVDGLQFVKKNAKPKKAVPQWKAEKKPSPYLIPLLKEEKVKKDKSKEALPQIKPVAKGLPKVAPPAEMESDVEEQRSHVNSHLEEESHEKKTVKRLVKKVDKPTGRKLPPSTQQPVERHSSLPVLPSISPRENPTPIPSTRNQPATKLPKMKISDIPTDNELRSILKASMTEPVLKTASNKPESNSTATVESTIETPPTEKPLEVVKSSRRGPPEPDLTSSEVTEVVGTEPKMTIEVEDDHDDYGYEFEEDEEDNGASRKEVSTPERLTKKLEKLEKSLVMKQMQMEDSPGHVTSEVEEQFKHLKLEAKAIRVELAAITGEISPTKLIKPDEDDNDYGDEDFMEDDEGSNLKQSDSVNNAPVAVTTPANHRSPNHLVSPPATLDKSPSKLWFLKEDQGPSSSTPMQHQQPLPVEETNAKENASEKTNPDPFAQKFIEVVGKPYHEELQELHQNISSPNKFSTSSAQKEKTAVHDDADDEKNDYGDEDFDGGEDDGPSNPAITLTPSTKAPVPTSLPYVDTPSKTMVPNSPLKEDPNDVKISSPAKVSNVKPPADDHDDYGEEEFDAYEDEFETGND